MGQIDPVILVLQLLEMHINLVVGVAKEPFNVVFGPSLPTAIVLICLSLGLQLVERLLELFKSFKIKDHLVKDRKLFQVLKDHVENVFLRNRVGSDELVFHIVDLEELFCE